jgi:hypothetical protein
MGCPLNHGLQAVWGLIDKRLTDHFSVRAFALDMINRLEIIEPGRVICIVKSLGFERVYNV